MFNRRKIAVDPGLHSCGWAVFEGFGKLPLNAGLIRPRLPQSAPLLERAREIGSSVADVARAWRVSKLWVEFPVSYGQGDSRADDIFRLCACIGAIAAVAGGDVEEVFVRDWKGQLPKTVVIKRIKKILGIEACARLGLKDDMWDAVGIGLYKQGFFE